MNEFHEKKKENVRHHFLYFLAAYILVDCYFIFWLLPWYYKRLFLMTISPVNRLYHPTGDWNREKKTPSCCFSFEGNNVKNQNLLDGWVPEEDKQVLLSFVSFKRQTVVTATDSWMIRLFPPWPHREPVQFYGWVEIIAGDAILSASLLRDA